MIPERVAFVESTLPGRHAANLEAVFVLIGAPKSAEDLGGAFQVLENLRELWPELYHFEKIRDLRPPGGRLHQLAATVHEVLGDRTTQARAPAEWRLRTAAGKRSYPQHGTMTTHPLPPLLYRLDARALGCPATRLLTATIITAATRVNRNDSIEVRRIAEAARTMRGFIANPTARMLADVLPPGEARPPSLSVLQVRLDRLKERWPDLSPILLLFRAALEGVERHGSGGRRSSRGGGPIVAPPPPSLRVRQTDDGSEILIEDSGTTEKRAVLEQAGSLAEESTGARQLVTVDLEDGAPLEGLSNRQVAIRARQAAAGIGRSNQALAGRLATLTNREVRDLLRWLTRNREGANRTWSPGQACMIACLLTGRAATDIALFEVIDLDVPGRDAPQAPALVRKGEEAWWLVRPGGPQLTANSDTMDLRQARTTELRLPCPDWFADHVDWAAGGTLAPHALEAPSLVTKVMRNFGEIAGDLKRYQLDRLRSWLPTALALAGHSPVAAALITGEVGTATRAAVHYERWYEVELQDAYREALSQLVRDRALPAALSQPTDASERRRYGSAFCPDSETFGVRMQALASRLKACRGKALRGASLIAFHNNFVVYTVLLLGVTAGLRAVNEPIPALGSIDPEMDFVLIRDKDIADGYNARLVPLIKQAIEQLRFWYAHVAYMVLHIALENPGRAGALGRACRNTELPAQPFFLSGDGHVIDYSVGELMSRARANGLPYVANVGRHLAASELKGRVSPDHARAFMGHWVRGTEPFASGSGLDPLNYRKDVRKAMEEMALLLHLVPVRGADHA